MWHGEEANWGDIPKLYYPAYVDTISIQKDENFCGNFFWNETKNAGKYIYEEVLPSKDPPEYYWKYIPPNPDWLQEYPSESDYIRNHPEVYAYPQNSNHTWTKGNIRAFGSSYTDSKEVVITYEITINRGNVPEFLRIPDDDLAWIRQYLPKFIHIHCTSDDYIFTLNNASTSLLEYVLIQNNGGYSFYEYYLQIRSSDTYSSGCLVSWSASTALPSTHGLANNKTYVAKCVNGSLRWIEETNS